VEDWNFGDAKDLATDLELDKSYTDPITEISTTYRTDIRKKPYNKKILSDFEKFLQPKKVGYNFKNNFKK
jgi:hypothetical protein